MALLNGIFMVLVIVTLGLALYRKFASAGEEDVVHLGAGEERMIPNQVALARKLDGIDKWGKMLTVAAVVVGVAIAGIYTYQAWTDPGSVPNVFSNFFRRTTP